MLSRNRQKQGKKKADTIRNFFESGGKEETNVMLNVLRPVEISFPLAKESGGTGGE